MSTSARTVEITCRRCKGNESLAEESSQGKGHELGQCSRKAHWHNKISQLWPDVDDPGTKGDSVGKDLQRNYELLTDIEGAVARKEKFNGKTVTKWMLEDAFQRTLKKNGDWVQAIKEETGRSKLGQPQTTQPTGTPANTTGTSVTTNNTAAQAPPPATLAVRSHPDDRRPFRGARAADQLPAHQMPVLDQAPQHVMSIKPDNDYHYAYKSSDRRHDFKNGASKLSDKYVPRKGFANEVGGLEIATNHFRLELKTPAVLYEYQLLGIDQELTRPKKRVIVERAINTANVLSTQQDKFATDYQKNIVAWQDLSLWKGQTTPAQMGETVAEFSVLNHRKGGESEQLPIRLEFLRKIDLDDLVQYVDGNLPEIALADDGRSPVPAGEERKEAEKRGVVMDALNLVLMKSAITGPSAPAFQTGKYKMFSKSGYDSLEKDQKKLVFRSYTTKPKLGMGEVLLNMSIGATMFHKSMTVDQYLACAGDSKKAVDAAKDDLRGASVYVNFERYPNARDDNDPSMNDPPRRLKTIRSFSDETAGQCFFVDDDGKSHSVSQHMQNTYGDRSHCTESSVLVNVGGKDAGEQQYYAAEDLTILPYQPYKRKLDPISTSAMIKKADRHPHANIKAIVTEGLPLLGIGPGRAPPQSLGNAGIVVHPSMLKVPAYVAKQPTVLYREAKSAKVNRGKWLAEPAEHKLLTKQHQFSGPPFLIHAPAREYQSSFAKVGDMLSSMPEFLKTGGLPDMKQFNLQKNCWPIRDGRGGSVDDFCNAIRTAANNGAGLVVLLLPKNDKLNQSRYANFKVAADQYEGMRSACLNEQKISSSLEWDRETNGGAATPDLPATGRFANYVRNVGMKLNMRLGNTNHGIESAVLAQAKLRTANNELDTIILGADVTHRSGGSAKHTPSIAALVGSVDQHFSLFFGSMSLQPNKDEKATEIIDGDAMRRMVKERLVSWSKQNGDRFPTNIIYYRDGVGDSQYAQVIKEEVNSIKLGWQKVVRDKENKDKKKQGQKKEKNQDLSSQAEPKITAIVVTKRHDTRIFPLHPKGHETTENGNVVPGTIVESTITSPYHQDFYLMSHNSIKGTGRPAHYFVLKDDIGLGIANIQQLSYDICYLYGRSTTAVSYATPAYYADRLCERGRIYLKKMLEEGEVFKDKSKEETMEVAKEMFKPRGEGNGGNPWHKNLNETMFWM